MKEFRVSTSRPIGDMVAHAYLQVVLAIDALGWTGRFLSHSR